MADKPPPRRRGRKPGVLIGARPGSLRWALQSLKVGTAFWTDQRDVWIYSAGQRCRPPVTATTQRWIAIHPDTREVRELTRVTITGRGVVDGE